MMQPARPYRLAIGKALCAMIIATPVWATRQEEGVLYLTVSVNGAAVPGLMRLRRRDDKLSILSEDAGRLNLRTEDLPEEGGYVLLTGADGLAVEYDDLSQSLRIVATKERLAGAQRLNDPHARAFLHERQLSEPLSGVAVDYSLFASRDRDNRSLSGYTQARTFGIGPGFLSTSFNTRLNQRGAAGSGSGTRRLTSAWNWENVDSRLSLTLGDSYTAAQSWSNSVRFGGLTLSRSYAMQPAVNTSSQDLLTDTATLPSTVDLYINGVKSASRRVAPGQFTLNTAPVLSGTGSAQVVITDINGQQRVIAMPLYGTGQLLSAGLTTWTLNVGWVRRDYSEKSFSYDADAMAVADIRHGLSRSLTLEAHAEQGMDLNYLGVGANYLLSPTLGVVHGDLSRGRYRGDDGLQWGAGWSWNNRVINIALNHVQRNASFRDISAIEDGRKATREESAFIGWTLPALGTFGTSWIDRQYPASSTQYAGLSWSGSFSRHFNMSASLTESLDAGRDKTFFLNINVPLMTSRDNFSAQYNHDSRGASELLSMSHSLESNQPGWGWNASARRGSSDDGHLVVQRRSSWSDMELGVNSYSSQREYYGSLSGAVGLFMGDLYATRKLGDSFALVDTDGVPDIPVLLEHHPAGKTDANGRLFLNDLLPYQQNHINIDALHLGADYRAPYGDRQVIPRRNGGAVARFSVYRTRALLLVAHTADGKPVPFAASASVEDSQGRAPAAGTASTVAGYDGNIYLEDPPAGGSVSVRWSSGACAITLPARRRSQATTTREVLCQ